MKALILDDESLPAKHLQKLIEEHCFEIEETVIFNSASATLKHLEKEDYDILFLDVEMPEMNGIEFINHAHLPSSTQIIFTTAYSQYAIDAFRANATHYILKPVMEEELVLAVRKAVKLLSKQKNKEQNSGIVPIFDGKEYQIVSSNDLIRLEADGSYTKYVLTDREVLSSKRIGAIEEKLPPQHFLRCHKSHIINVTHIKSFGRDNSTYVTLTNGDVVPISSSKKAKLYALLSI